MNIEIDRDTLLDPLSNVAGIVERKLSLPILSNILLEGSQGNLRFTATDLEMQISLSVETKLEDSFETTISATKILDITRALPEKSKLNIQINDTTVLVKALKSKFNLQTLAAQDYPVMKKDEEENTFVKLKQKDFKAILKQVDFSMAQQDIRYYLNGLLFEVDNQKLNIVGTDGHRLSFTSIKLQKDFGKIQTIIPRKTILELVKLLGDGDDDIEINISKTQAHFHFNNIDLITKVIDGKFPDYSRVIPVGHPNIFEIDRQTLLTAMQRASILSNEKYRGIRVVITKNNLKMISTNSEQEQAEEEMEIKYQGEDIDVGFNVTYLIDVLNNIQYDKLNFAFKDSSSSCLVTIPNNEDYKYVVMPMRI